MAKLVLNSIDKGIIEIDGYEFEVRGLTREEALNFRSSVAKLEKLPEEEQEKALAEIEQMLLNTCIKDKKGIELILKSSAKTYRAVLDYILNLSGLGEQEAKN